jgi:hypothetical protein
LIAGQIQDVAAEPGREQRPITAKDLLEAVDAAGDAISEFHMDDNGLAIKK